MPKLILTSVVVGFHGFFIILGIAYGYGVNKHVESLEQPIAFSHHKHVKKAGLQCTDCHTKAATTTRAGIPPMEKCMECHATIKTDSPEIQKLHAYYGKQLFEVDAKNHSEELKEGKLSKLEKVFAENKHILPVNAMLQTQTKDSKWKITDTGQEGKEYEVTESEGMLEIRGVKKAIPWKRVYWLPDHVYFSHKRHITNKISRYFLFNTSATDSSGVEQTKYLESLAISEDLKTAFQENKMQISEDARVEAQDKDEWWIIDPAKDQPYSITKEGKHIKVSKVGLDCTECHGKVEYMDIPRKLPSLRMGWCVQCHTKKGASLDCVTCHK
ncbi:cytochrome c3 family protein [Candidatus Uabimicrobium sp. HlEnr_7]|uniref:cytochrome c3 family protein n=1 Tax=Candidatus Uabimicrobium helgolandensis TaxID=3095367 RepID=UPI00355921BD